MRQSWLKEAVRNMQIKVLYVKTAMNTSDIGTKAVSKVVFKDFADALLGYRKLKVSPDHKCMSFEEPHTSICGIGFWAIYKCSEFEALAADYPSL